ncbi:MAG TPA: phosphotransferase [Caulobacteraceae bacterium]|nr:phosphotransferase [Caulobacteraceae bacterium]
MAPSDPPPSEEGDREAEAAAARAALAEFGVAAESVELVARSENVTFRVRTKDADFALRLHRPGYQSLTELNSERTWTRALSEAGFSVPAGVRAPDGRDFVTAGPWLAGLARWVAGEAVGSENPSPALYFRLGEMAADLHAHSALWAPPAGFSRRVLDADGLMGAEPNWGRFWEHPALSAGERDLFERARAALRGALLDLPRDGRRFGMIHADLHPGNLVVDGEQLGLIDFDDAAFGWYLYDLAVALVHHQGKAGFDDLAAALLAGYRSRRALGQEEAARLPMFLLVRRLAVIGWLHQRPEIDAAQHLASITPLTAALCEEFLS